MTAYGPHVDTEYTEADFAEAAPPVVQPRRRDRDLVAVALMGIGVVGFIGTLFVLSPVVGALALFAGIGAVGAVLGMSNDSTTMGGPR